jgi:DNA replication protein DnaC
MENFDETGQEGLNALNNRQQSELEALVAETHAAKLRAARRAEKIFKDKAVRSHDEVSDVEYSQRLKRSLNKDKLVVDKVNKERIERSLEEWKRRVGPTFAGATVDHPIVLDRIARLSQNKGTHKTSLILHGNMGVGKSWTCYAYINMAIAAGVVTAGQIVADTETAVLGKITVSGYKKPEMLEELFHDRNKIYFIDDVGQGYFSDVQKRTEVWFELIDHIYTHQLTILITTNLNQDQLNRWIGPRAFDRLRAIVADGYIEPSKVNRRDAVLEQQEKRYRS